MNEVASKRTWTRFIPRQFSLRALLLVITVACLFTWWYVQLPEGHITLRQSDAISLGMTPSEVVAQLGEPIRIERVGIQYKPSWWYRIDDKWQDADGVEHEGSFFQVIFSYPDNVVEHLYFRETGRTNF